MDQDYRYERKAILNGEDAARWRELLMTHPLLFQESYPPRKSRRKLDEPLQAIVRSFQEEGDWKERGLALRPTLLNRYLRKYFASTCGRFRVTIDAKLEFSAPPNPWQMPTIGRFMPKPMTILEL